MFAIMRKELADYFNSLRFMILFIVVYRLKRAGAVFGFQRICGAPAPGGLSF